MTETLRWLVLAESPSTDKAAADRCARLLAAEWRRRGARVEFLRQKQHGDQVRAAWGTGSGGQVLVLGHYDTVHASGTLRTMPFRVARGRAYGPGTFDMKAGLVQALFAVDALRETGAEVRGRVVFLWTSDEETGSQAARAVIEREARRSDAVLVLEPAMGPKGLLKTSRKAAGEMELLVRGRAAHAGIEPEKGVNAVHELALQIARMVRWNGRGNGKARGFAVHANIMEGGTRANVIAEQARAVLDLRATRAQDMRTLEKRLRALRPILPGTRLELRGGFSRPPLERKMSAALYARARELAREIGVELGECSSGGGSDGNLTAALGVQTLDGLGAVGGGAHSANEHVILRTMPERAALLAALLISI